MKRAVAWLITKDTEESYYFAEKSPKELSANSRVLFSFDARIFGQAVLKENVRVVPFEEQEAQKKMGRPVYKHSVILKKGSVEVFPYYPTKKEITEGLDIQFGQVFRYILRNNTTRS